MMADREGAAITVKLRARMDPEGVVRHFGRQLPQATKSWGDCRFVFDPEARDYDWLVVYHDLARAAGKPGLEQLACPRARTILVTTEPSTITVYGTDYLRQYGNIITSQEPWIFRHPRVVFTQPGLIWFYGFPFEEGPLRTYDDLQATPPPAKSRLISTVCSNRAGGLTLHSRRVSFTRKLQIALPELDVFGHGIKPMSDKAEALDPYQYHIAVENHVYRHHLTEKLPDALLGYTLPFYHGCPNASDYFPRESFIPIDIGDFNAARDIIRSTINNDEYRDRLPYIIEARRRVLEEHNLFAVLERYIRANHEQDGSEKRREKSEEVIMNRQTLRIKKPLSGIRSLFEKALVKGRHYL
jgi:hypothetical protein